MRETRIVIRRFTTTLGLGAILLLGFAQAQVALNEFTEGTPIVADEVNENFTNLAGAIGANADAIDAAATRIDSLEGTGSTGTVWATREDLSPAQGTVDFDYSSEPQKSELVLIGTGTGVEYCFRGRIDLPHQATVTEFGAIAKAFGGHAEIALERRAWAAGPYDTLVSVQATGSSHAEVSTTATPLPVDVNSDEYGYFVRVCLQDGGGMRSAYVTFDLP